MHRRGHDRRGRVGAHAAGIGALIVIEDTLVILRRCQRKNMLAVGQDHERDFFAVEKFFDDDFVAGFAKGFSHQDLVDGAYALQ